MYRLGLRQVMNSSSSTHLHRLGLSQFMKSPNSTHLYRLGLSQVMKSSNHDAAGAAIYDVEGVRAAAATCMQQQAEITDTFTVFMHCFHNAHGLQHFAGNVSHSSFFSIEPIKSCPLRFTICNKIISCGNGGYGPKPLT